MAFLLQGPLHKPGCSLAERRGSHLQAASSNGASSNGARAWHPPQQTSEPKAPSPDLLERIQEAGVESWQGTGLQYLSDAARVRMPAWPCLP